MLMNNSHKSKSEIARAVGHDDTKILQMLEQGVMVVPFNLVVPLANALDADPGALLREWFDSYMPSMLPLLEKYLYPRNGDQAA
jgi:hypothetical protein